MEQQDTRKWNDWEENQVARVTRFPAYLPLRLVGGMACPEEDFNAAGRQCNRHAKKSGWAGVYMSIFCRDKPSPVLL